MGDPATPSSSQHPVIPVASPCKVVNSKNAIIGVIYSTWEVLCEAKPLNSAVDFEFLICEFLSALHDLRAFSDSVSQTRYTQFCQKAQVHLDSFVQPLWLSWCAELISPERATAFSANKELSPPPATEASARTPSDTGEVVASDSPTASTGTDDTLLLVALASFSVVVTPITASAALHDPVPKFEFQAHATNPVTIDPPSDSDIAAMEVDPPLATVVDKPTSAPVSETIELSSNDENDSDSDEVKFVGGTIPNLSSAYPKKGKGHGRKSVKASKMTTASEDQVPPGSAKAIYHLFVPDIDDADGWLSLKKLYHQRDWPLPKMPDASVIAKAFSHQGDYDKQMRDANTAGSDYTAELELLLDTLIDEYETAIALTPCLCPAHILPDTPKPDVESDAEDAPEVVTVKQEKGTTGPSRRKLAIPPPPRGCFNRPLKHPRFDASDPDDIMMQHAHAGIIVALPTRVLKPHSSKGKSHAKGSSKVATVKSEPIRASTAIIELSAASTQLERMIELSQQLLEENCALRAHKS
ncbi:uncharacterized protein LAESUDRAFT_763459 [Laetiporus sulphureus 93-53]|uniref:Uncharacterized protein n=1 Tax=Laetiporus sulphureus 93-53 TaxID=1314785 RepID=A0A165BVC2_9APHY|nr:uncharacterized protein LAESUDRAFT_763459 [Laetiporus sulphureus 93-53]KZT01722.1 hypothetical protein LAESUDRAFT_763459 [Laetiporus sulphureus 93-53]